jgi:hypothetical protein
METLKQLLIAALAPAARRGALIEGQRHALREGWRASFNARRGKRARVLAGWRPVFTR